MLTSSGVVVLLGANDAKSDGMAESFRKCKIPILRMFHDRVIIMKRQDEF